MKELFWATIAIIVANVTALTLFGFWLGSKLARIEYRLTVIEDRLANMEIKLIAMERRLDSMKSKPDCYNKSATTKKLV